MIRVDGYLSRRIQTIYPDAVVKCDDHGPVEVWFIERPGKPSLGLGSCFHDAKQGIDAIIRAVKSLQERGEMA